MSQGNSSDPLYSVIENEFKNDMFSASLENFRVSEAIVTVTDFVGDSRE